MKHLSLKLIFLPLILLTIIKGLNAQSNCTLPATPHLYVISTSTNSAEIAWTEVPGAAGYQIETVEVSSGNIVSSLSTVDNTIVITGLQAGTEYDVYVITQCDNGLPGGSTNIRLTSGIVIVDVIIQLSCDPASINTYNNNIYNPNDAITYNLDHNQVIVFDGEITAGNNAGPFKLLFKMNNSNNNTPPELFASTTADFETRIEFFSNSPNGGLTRVDYRTSGNGTFQPLAYFSPSFSSYSTLELTWLENVNVNYTRCNNTGGRGKINGDQDSSELEVSPNPTNGWLSILAHEDTAVLITDVNGQIWYESELFGGEPHEIDATDWPNGTYIIRTIENDEVVNTLLFKTN